MASKEGMSLKDRRFADEYLKDFNATRAAKRAGFPPASAHTEGCKALKKPYVAEYIDKRQAAIAKRYEVTQERIVGELAKLAFASMGDFVRVTPEGDPYLDFSDMDQSQAASLIEVTVDEYTDGRGDDARDVKKVKIKLHDKRSALVDLGKHLGLFDKSGDPTDDGSLVVKVEGGLPDDA